MTKTTQYQITTADKSIIPNLWDIVVVLFILGSLALLAWAGSQMTGSFQLGEPIKISLDPKMLPEYSLRTVLRMFIALFCSLVFTFTVAPLAAKNRHFEKFIIPFIDIMESVPILGMLAIATVTFIAFFPNSLLGPECAAIFAIFTSQVWNMTLSLYQSLRTVPKDLIDAAKAFKLSSWQRFWRVEVPHAIPGLLWNTMISMSAGWFFVVASEAILIANQEISLPGLGSYVGKAIHQANVAAIFYAIFAMFIIIILYDQLFFRPLLSWAEKFKAEIHEEEHMDESWLFDLLGRTKLLKFTKDISERFYEFFINRPSKPFFLNPKIPQNIQLKLGKSFILIWYLGLLALITYISGFLLKFVINTVTLEEVMHVAYLGGVTALKVMILIILASLLWVPVGVYIGLRPRLMSFFQPFIQIMAAFPANFFYPLFVILILKYQLNANIWTMPLMILGTQWYILFNVIVGTASIPKDVRLAAASFQIKGMVWWKRLILPSIFPYYVTGAMAAAGGCWNASIIADVVSWGDKTVEAIGIGQYIVEQTINGDYPRLTLGIAMMSAYVVLINRILWHKLYNLAETRFSVE